ncbi:MAG: hypothetical protein QXS20_10345 [Candidatus Thorarchaeota archaeon]
MDGKCDKLSEARKVLVGLLALPGDKGQRRAAHFVNSYIKYIE